MKKRKEKKERKKIILRQILIIIINTDQYSDSDSQKHTSERGATCIPSLLVVVQEISTKMLKRKEQTAKRSTRRYFFSLC